MLSYFGSLLICFQFFFTLTSGDMRWSANFTPVLEELGCKVTYAVDKEGRNKVNTQQRYDITLKLPLSRLLSK